MSKWNNIDFFRYIFLSRGKYFKSELTSYTYGGKIEDVIRKFSQSWPVYDFSFRLATPEELDQFNTLDTSATYSTLDAHVKFRQQLENGPATPQPPPDPDSVDLYICIKDEPEPENQRQGEPSYSQGGSRMSLNSLLNRGSPQAVDDEQNLLQARERNLQPDSDQDKTQLKQLNDYSRQVDDTGSIASSTTSSQGSRPVEMMVDVARGNVCLKEQEAKPENGATVWQKKDNASQESESKL